MRASTRRRNTPSNQRQNQTSAPIAISSTPVAPAVRTADRHSARRARCHALGNRQPDHVRGRQIRPRHLLERAVCVDDDHQQLIPGVDARRVVDRHAAQRIERDRSIGGCRGDPFADGLGARLRRIRRDAPHPKEFDAVERDRRGGKSGLG
jgi:hypothetical protein